MRWVILCVFILVFACTSQVNETCDGSTCKAGQRCEAGICACESDQGCGFKQSCTIGRCTDIDCVREAASVGGTPPPPGSKPDECCEGLVAVKPTGKGFSEIQVCSKCSSDKQCQIGQNCKSGGCVCMTDQGCPKNQKCEYGKCVDMKCVEEGGNVGGMPPPQEYHVSNECCQGLSPEMMSDQYNSDCTPEPMADAPMICINCGDGVCSQDETKCNCPKDCTSVCSSDYECIATGFAIKECCSGCEVFAMTKTEAEANDNWRESNCDILDCLLYDCYNPYVGAECLKGECKLCGIEGRRITHEGEAGGPDKCCNGLILSSVIHAVGDDCVPEMDVGVCTNCGDGTCGTGENKCNCPEDCTDKCGSEGMVVGGFEATKDQSVPTECCSGLVKLAFAYDDNCEPLRTLVDPGMVCTNCGNGECGAGETKCNCPEDCPA